jgi:hypothetical protein
LCHTVTQCDMMTPKSSKTQKDLKICQFLNEKNATHFDTTEHFDTSEKPKSTNSLDPIKTAEGTVGAPTCL